MTRARKWMMSKIQGRIKLRRLTGGASFCASSLIISGSPGFGVALAAGVRAIMFPKTPSFPPPTSRSRADLKRSGMMACVARLNNDGLGAREITTSVGGTSPFELPNATARGGDPLGFDLQSKPVRWVFPPTHFLCKRVPRRLQTQRRWYAAGLLARHPGSVTEQASPI